MNEEVKNPILDTLTAVSSIDGRYRAAVAPLAEHFSEYGLIRKRLTVECEYLVALSEAGVMRALTEEEKTVLRQLPHISLEEAVVVKKIEKEGYEGIPATNHDVKAIEYFIKKKLANSSLKDIAEWTHFALTSEDVNSVAYGIALRGALQSEIFPALENLRTSLEALAKEHAATPMLARTHGQPATNWQEFAKNFITRLNTGYKIPLELNPITTQIEPHDTYAEMFDNLRRINTILLDFSQDTWRYISDGWLSQKTKEGEVGSSAMPHKVNPIDFENAEGNIGVASELFEHFSRKLPVSRLQRDLSDSTVERVFGVAFAHALVAYKSLLRGLGKVSVNKETMLQELQAHPEVLAEAIQTALR